MASLKEASAPVKESYDYSSYVDHRLVEMMERKVQALRAGESAAVKVKSITSDKQRG